MSEVALRPAPTTVVDEARRLFERTDQPLWVYGDGKRLILAEAPLASPAAGTVLRAQLPALPAENLGESRFRNAYRSRYAYATGAMANGIASVAMVEALGKAGLLASYGAGGVLDDEVEAAVRRLRASLGTQPFAVNVIHSPHEMRMEQRCVDICLRHRVDVVEASAFMKLTLPIVQYRVAGLRRLTDGRVFAGNRVIAKISRPEVAAHFLAPPPAEMVQALLANGAITVEQAELAGCVPMADDITVEADSGGHTDRRSLTVLLPAIIGLRDRLLREYDFVQRGFHGSVSVGAAGGIGTGAAAAAAFAMGAAYVVTGSINQACVEAGTSETVRRMLAQADLADVDMAPAADMFEMGVQLQVLRRGTFFPMRARLLYQLYVAYPSLDEIPAEVRQRLEKQIFRRTLDEVWHETLAYFQRRDPRQIEAAEADPKRKMALVFRSYLGQASHWANAGVADRAMDYQIWAGPAIGGFNQWVRGTYLEAPEARHVVDVAEHIMRGAVYQLRLSQLRWQGVEPPSGWCDYRIQPMTGAHR
jgi:trans-AT polyketide synthase, acyltransferase and oxidoreductase domains